MNREEVQNVITYFIGDKTGNPHRRIGDVAEKLGTQKLQEIVDIAGEPTEEVKEKIFWKWWKCGISLSLQEIVEKAGWEWYDPNPPTRETAQRLNSPALELFKFLATLIPKK